MEPTRAAMIAIDLMALHLDDAWTFSFDHARTRLGSCNSTDRIITLSRPLVLLNNESAIIDTVLHEVAHAKAGARAGHGPHWKAWAIKLGAMPRRTLSNGVTLPPEPWRGRCPGCNQVILRHRRSNVACASCCKRYNRGRWAQQYLFIWEENVDDVLTNDVVSSPVDRLAPNNQGQ